MIQNKQYTLKKPELASFTSIPDVIKELTGHYVLRWCICKVTDEELVIEATTYDGELGRFAIGASDRHYPGKRVVVSIIPTGVGCDIGGYAGDAAPITSMLAAATDYLITNPNAVNASNFINLESNVVYTEGSSIDLFCQGSVDFHLPYTNRVGLIIDKVPDQSLDVIFNVLNAVRAIHGVDVRDYVITERPIGGRCVWNKSGIFVGTVDNPDVLFGACDELIAKGVNAIAVASTIQDLPLNIYADHFAGKYPNPIGGTEAIISYLITRRYQMPSAHAPLINVKQLELEHNIVDARGAGEMSSTSGLACILIGLRRAPQLGPRANSRVADVINLNNLLAVVAPAGCLGGVPALYAQAYGVPVIAVRQNRTILDVTKSKLGLQNVIEAETYAEAAGILLALQRGINLESIVRPLQTLRYCNYSAS